MNNRKKICFLTPVHFLVGKGGAEYQIRLVMDTIGNTDRYDIHFLCRRVPNYMTKNHQVRKIGTENILGSNGTFLDAPRIYRALKQISPQIIYQNVGCADTGIAALYAKRHGARLIWHIASDIDVAPELEVNIKKRFVGTIDRLFLNYGIRNAHIIAGQTKHQSTILEKRFGRKCDAFIPIGHPFPECEPRKNEKITVLWLAHMKLLKQPEIFVNLARKFGKVTNVAFVMMGHPAKGEWFTLLMRKINALPNLTYLGRVPQEEVNRRLSDGHILVNTSRYEGFSNTFVQAWMRQVPVISLHVDPDNILVREGIGFHSLTFEGLCRDVALLIENREVRKEMGKRARKYAYENHTVQKMVQRFTNLIESP